MAARKENSRDIYNRILLEIKAGSLKPVYYLYGEEEFYQDRLLEAFTALMPPHERDFNYDLLYGQEIKLGKLLSLAKSYPMMAERRMIIVRNFLQIEKTDDDIQAFIQYLEQPNPTCLLILFDAAKPAGNTRFGAALARGGRVGYYQFEAMPEYLIPDWVVDWARDVHHKQFAPGAAQVLAQLVGNNLQLLAAEIDKVCTYSAEAAQIGETEVHKVIGSYREYTVLELKEAVIQRNLERSLQISEQILLQSKNDTGELIRLIGFFTSTFTNMWHLLRLKEKGLPKSRIQSEMHIDNAWFFNKLWEDASRYRYADMSFIFEALLDADRASKGFTTLDSAAILFFLVERIIAGASFVAVKS